MIECYSKAFSARISFLSTLLALTLATQSLSAQNTAPTTSESENTAPADAQQTDTAASSPVAQDDDETTTPSTPTTPVETAPQDTQQATATDAPAVVQVVTPPPETAPPAQEPPPPLPWRNSFFTWTHGATFNTFAPGAQLSYNPVYYQFFSFALRWYLSNQTFFVVQQFPYVEFTEPDGAASRWDFQLSDTLVDLRHNIMWEGFVVIPSARVGLPTSKASIAAQRYFQLGAGLTVARPVPEIAGTVAISASYRRWIAGSNVATAQGGVCARAGEQLAASACDASGFTALGNDILAGLILNVSPWEGWTFSFNGFFRWAEGLPLSTSTIDTGTGSVQIGDSSHHWRMFTSLSLGAAYDVNSWMNLSLSVANGTSWTPFWSSAGNVKSPFNPDTQISLSATIQLDALFIEFSEHHEEEDGLTPEERQRRRQGLAMGSGSSVRF